MSYILDALKRSQQQRELGQVPTLADAPYPDAGRPARSGPWLAVALLLATVAVLLAIYAAFGVRSGGVTAAAPPLPLPLPPVAPALVDVPVPAVIAPATPDGATNPQPLPRPSGQVPPAPRAPGRAAAPAVPTAPPVESPAQPGPADEILPELRREIAAFKAQLQRDQASLVEPAPAQIPAAPVVSSPARPSPPPLAELPPELRQGIPELRVSVYVYSADPQRRFVILNSRRLSEGERSADGLLLEEIGPNGLVLEYGGRRFFRPR